MEMKLFKICRDMDPEKRNIMVNDINDFENNLNNRFSFLHIKKMINFSLFILGGKFRNKMIYLYIIRNNFIEIGGAVLNCVLNDGFDPVLQDLDFFWLGGNWICFINAVERFKRSAYRRIIKENRKRKVIEFVLFIEHDRCIRIQFIFARVNANIPFILYTFDLDIVQVAYDGKRIICVSEISFYIGE